MLGDVGRTIRVLVHLPTVIQVPEQVNTGFVIYSELK